MGKDAKIKALRAKIRDTINDDVGNNRSDDYREEHGDRMVRRAISTSSRAHKAVNAVAHGEFQKQYEEQQRMKELKAMGALGQLAEEQK